MFKKNLTTFLLITLSYTVAQIDTVKYQWPDQPLNTSKVINGTFAEFRNTLTSDHFHNAVDIGEPDNNPVYACLDGIVQSIVSTAGSNSYVSVRTPINGKWKRLTYLHINPNPSLSVGQQVFTGVTVMGTIHPGMGHVHLTERELVVNPDFYAAEINNIRENGGLFPYTDTQNPVIHQSTLRFYTDRTTEQLSPNALFGKVDIKIKVEERNGGTSSGSNNGTYILGYRVWNESQTQIVYEPFGNGVVYRFDRMPSNSYVHNVFVKGEATLSDPIYWLTNGNGADAINSSQMVVNNYFDTELLAEGLYKLEIFTEDTRGNKANHFSSIRIATPPEMPRLDFVTNPNKRNGVYAGWKKNEDPDLMGYRLYYSVNTQLSTWQLAADESMLTKETTEISFNSPSEFIQPIEGDIYFFYLTAVDSLGAESKASDIYSRAPHTNGSSYADILIVDGFDRFGGSGAYMDPNHDFNTSYFIPFFISDSLNISSAEDEAVEEGRISLNDYDVVAWFIGDGGGPDKSFTTAQQLLIQNYLESGGKLFVSGSEIGIDLATKFQYTQESDSAFFRNYLKSEFIYNGNTSMKNAAGAAGTAFEGISIGFGHVYPQFTPDDVQPVDGAEAILYYDAFRAPDDPRVAGVGYKGKFVNSQIDGALIYIPFAVETEANMIKRKDLISAALNYFEILTDIKEESPELFPAEYILEQNYPNPFNPTTTIEYSISTSPRPSPHAYRQAGYQGEGDREGFSVSLQIYDILGREVATLVNTQQKPGRYKVEWDASNIPSGIYFYQLKTVDYKQTRKMMLLK